MAKIVWAETAIEELNAICEYIEVVNEQAAKTLFQKVFDTVSNLSAHPQIGSFPPEIGGKRYRQLICNPCRVFYRYEKEVVLIVHVFREERDLTEDLLEK